MPRNIIGLVEAVKLFQEFDGLESWLDEDKILSSQSFNSPTIDHPLLVDLLCEVEADLPDLVLVHGYVIRPDVSKQLAKHSISVERRMTDDVTEYCFVLSTPTFSIFF